MKKILFITNRNVLTTSGELRLIKNRAESLFSDYSISTDFIAVNSIDRINSKKKETIHSGGSLIEVPASLTNLVSLYTKFGSVKKIIVDTLKAAKYEVVILSGPGMAIYTRIIKKYGPKVFVDIHGALEDALVLSSSCGFIKGLKYKAIYHLEDHALRKNLKYADGAFVVTRALETYIKDRYELNPKFSFYIVPCATTGIDNVVENRVLYRTTYRKKYNISDDEIVFVYSGGLSPWQCVDETIELYKNIDDRINRRSRLLLFSHMKNQLQEKVGTDSRFIIDSHRPEDLRMALCAADFAFMLRQDCPTNNVAFPNKFLEYVESVLGIITTPFVYEIYNQVKKFKLGIIISDLNDSETIIKSIGEFTPYSPEESKDVLLYNSFKNTLKEFAESINTQA